MKSYTQGRNLYGKWSKNASTANLSQGDEVANDDYRAVCGIRDWPFLERLRTILTTTNQFVNLPYDCDQVREIAVIVSSKRYVPRLSPDRAHWDMLNTNTITSDIPQWYFVFNGQLGLWPTPVTAGNTINVTQKSRVIDLSAADYTTGNIVSITNGALAVVGSGTAWTERMVGRFIRFTYSDTANTGDGVWYEIAGVSSATALTLVRAYGGTSIAAGSASYTIGQMPLLPEDYHDLPWLSAASDYWSKESDNRADRFQTKHDTKLAQMTRSYSSPTTSLVIDDGGDDEILNPNLTISI